MIDKFFVDTNILVYSYEKAPANGSKAEVCRKLVLDCFQGKSELVISNQVLAEFCSVITRKTAHPLSFGEAQKLLGLLLESKFWHKVTYTGQTINRALGLSEIYHISFWDALIAATGGICPGISRQAGSAPKI